MKLRKKIAALTLALAVLCIGLPSAMAQDASPTDALAQSNRQALESWLQALEENGGGPVYSGVGSSASATSISPMAASTITAHATVQLGPFTTAGILHRLTFELVNMGAYNRMGPVYDFTVFAQYPTLDTVSNVYYSYFYEQDNRIINVYTTYTVTHRHLDGTYQNYAISKNIEYFYNGSYIVR